MNTKSNNTETKTPEAAVAVAPEKQGFFTGFNLKHAAVTAIATSIITALGMHYFGGGSEETAE